MSVMASVRAVARESIPKPPSKTAITLVSLILVAKF